MLLRYLRGWKPDAAWGESYVRPAFEACASDSEAERFDGWRRLALMLGDSGAPELCLVVALHARTLVDDRRIAGHIDLCLLDLGLAVTDKELIAIADLGAPETLQRDGSALARWLSAALQPFDGELARAATFCLRLAALRTGVIDGPAEPTVEQLLDPPRTD